MKKIMVTGASAGAGKSTFAKELGEALNIEVYHLDTLFWKPGWIEATIDEFAEAQRKIIHYNDQWIIEGNYSNTYEIRAEYADTIVYLELPLYLCLYRVLKRWLKHRGKTRPDLGEGCPDKLDWDFIWFICSTYYPRKKKMMDRFRYFQTLGSRKNIYVLKGKKELHSFLKDIESSSTSKLQSHE
ncbi:adenylate kinase family enzyme [Bacillus pakistanensis]|uniref:Adenylate kinase family enzyme n=1 Tax=Rossellomorea pakistanensis TaxID=992288 RepID=A0ABS2N9V4_9BACI|nr:topology modulation protein [Bacillus pakistanensis]MBM7584642.1 adenylate kinase family enzyme [Bacillus pakistanensis]